MLPANEECHIFSCHVWVVFFSFFFSLLIFPEICNGGEFVDFFFIIYHRVLDLFHRNALLLTLCQYLRLYQNIYRMCVRFKHKYLLLALI